MKYYFVSRVGRYISHDDGFEYFKICLTKMLKTVHFAEILDPKPGKECMYFRSSFSQITTSNSC